MEKCIPSPVAPMGWPLASRPPLGLMTYFPPYYVRLELHISSSKRAYGVIAIVHNLVSRFWSTKTQGRICDELIEVIPVIIEPWREIITPTSFGAKQSCSSITPTSSRPCPGANPACAKTLSAHRFVIPYPTSSIALSESNVAGSSVSSACATISIAWFSSL
jgi:hypothetical protein